MGFLHVLPWRWSLARVQSYVVALFYNSSMTISERRDWMNSKRRKDIPIFNDGRITIGDYPPLMAFHVSDFSVEYDSKRRVEIVTYTLPSGYKVNPRTGRPEAATRPIPTRLEIPLR
jgi:hypothetical protein